MASPNTILIAGAGIGGLTTAIALADSGFPVVVLEAASELAEIGAGIQLSPNATRVLAALGLLDALRPYASAPEAVHVRSGRSGRLIASIPLADTQSRYGAPYWVVHRADLQRVLAQAASERAGVTLRLGFNVLDHAVHAGGVTVAGKTRSGVMVEEQGAALIGADGLWSTVRRRLGHAAVPRFRRRTAWRSLVEADALDPAWSAPSTHLWLGADAHLVHYPVRGGSGVNIVAIVTDTSEAHGWSRAGERERLLARFAHWAPQPRSILSAPTAWQVWSLFDLPPLPHLGAGPVTLLGDAAHAALPFLAQGAAMAIEDAAVLTDCLENRPDDIETAFRNYETMRQSRTARVAQESARMATIYHHGPLLAAARNFVMRRTGGERLALRQDWLYRWPN